LFIKKILHANIYHLGGCVEFRSALLARKGFASFALAYFNHEGLPSSYLEYELSYFDAAVDWLLSQEKVKSIRMNTIRIIFNRFAPKDVEL
jgi:hypothetical protein